MDSSSIPQPATFLWERLSRSDDESIELGRRLGRSCGGGEIILLEGPLGAGKTRLAGGIAQGLGIARPVTSPTYLILRSYDAPRGLTLHHVDFYRLSSQDELATVGLEDCLGERSVVVVEWPERCPHAFDAWTLALRIEIVDDATRRIGAFAGGLPHERFARQS
jgi:tRNA threonylcarbamoyladenosine biosynthesis protein TsaE